MARRGLALVSKQTRGRQAGRQAGRQEAIAEGAEEAHVRAGDRGVGDRE
jgi:predicted transposase YdaD